MQILIDSMQGKDVYCHQYYPTLYWSSRQCSTRKTTKGSNESYIQLERKLSLPTNEVIYLENKIKSTANNWSSLEGSEKYPAAQKSMTVQ